MASMMTRLSRLLLVGLLGVLVGCGSSRFAAEVTQFHDLPAVPDGRGFVVVPADPDKAGSLEFRAYARMVAAELAARGFRPADSETGALTVSLDYAVDIGRVESYPVPVYGYFPDRFASIRGVDEDGEPFSAHIHESGSFEPLGFAQATQTLYRRTLTVDILDRTVRDGDRPVSLYEGRVVSLGPESELAPIVPRMIRALFVDFPGPSGATRTIVLDPPP